MSIGNMASSTNTHRRRTRLTLPAGMLARANSACNDGHVPAQPAKSGDPTLARDHLANERTYLAWLRTAAAVMALGLAVAGLSHRVSATTAVAGVLLVITGASGVGYGTVRYRRVTRELDSGNYVADGGGPAALIASSVLVAAVVVALVLILVGQY
jgi:putative membrane protein